MNRPLVRRSIIVWMVALVALASCGGSAQQKIQVVTTTTTAPWDMMHVDAVAYWPLAQKACGIAPEARPGAWDVSQSGGEHYIDYYYLDPSTGAQAVSEVQIQGGLVVWSDCGRP